MIGVASVVAYEPLESYINKTVPVFNLVPAQGEPARFGFEVIGKIPIVIDTSVRSGKDYAVVATVKNATQTAALLSSQVTLWGVPGDPRHNSSRGWECIDNGFYANQVKKTCPTTSAEPETPFLTLPTSCAGDPAAEPVLEHRSGLVGRTGSLPGSRIRLDEQRRKTARLRRLQRPALQPRNRSRPRRTLTRHPHGP